jgi:hypothetical protein
MLLCVADRQATAERFGRFAGRAPTREGRFDIVALDRGRLVFVAAEDASRLPHLSPPALPYMAGQALRSRDLRQTREALAAAGVAPVFASDTLICVSADDALGSMLLFHAPSVMAPWAALAAQA